MSVQFIVFDRDNFSSLDHREGCINSWLEKNGDRVFQSEIGKTFVCFLYEDDGNTGVLGTTRRIRNGREARQQASRVSASLNSAETAEGTRVEFRTVRSYPVDGDDRIS